MSNELREQIRNNLNLKNIYELLEIWKTNNRVVWSDATFEVLKEILKERIGEVPPQDEPILENKEDSEESDDINDGLEEWEAKLLDDENQPELYDTLDVLRLRDNIDKVAFAAIIIYVLLGLLNFSFTRMLFQGIVLSPSEIVQSIPDMLFTTLSVGFRIVITYFPLKALSQILRILMEMEFISRKRMWSKSVD
jgi:hypothetical protein